MMLGASSQEEAEKERGGGTVRVTQVSSVE